MNKIFSVIPLSIFATVILLLVDSVHIYAEPLKSNSWVFITEYHSYNKNVVLSVSSDVKSVWTNKILTDFQKQNNKIPNINSISSLMEINCKKREFRIKEDIGYDYKGNILRVDKYKKSEWHSINPLTPVEIICDKICTAPKKKPKKK